MTTLTEGELPSEAMRRASRTWSLICSIGAEGRSFRLSEIESRLTSGGAKAKATIRRTVRELLAAGNLTRSDGSREIANRNATYRLAATDPPKSLLPQVAAFVNVGVDVQIPRSRDGLWSLFIWLDHDKRGFTLSQVVRMVGEEIAREDVHAYVRALLRGGFLSAADRSRDPILHVAKRQSTTPLLRADGAATLAALQEDRMWRSFKMASSYMFASDVAAFASQSATDRTVVVPLDAAARYCEALHAAGYLLRDRQEPPQYRLKPRMWTGPGAPRVLRARFVWDPNERRVMGPAIVVEGSRK